MLCFLPLYVVPAKESKWYNPTSIMKIYFKMVTRFTLISTCDSKILLAKFMESMTQRNVKS